MPRDAPVTTAILPCKRPVIDRSSCLGQHHHPVAHQRVDIVARKADAFQDIPAMLARHRRRAADRQRRVGHRPEGAGMSQPAVDRVRIAGHETLADMILVEQESRPAALLDDHRREASRAQPVHGFARRQRCQRFGVGCLVLGPRKGDPAVSAGRQPPPRRRTELKAVEPVGAADQGPVGPHRHIGHGEDAGTQQRGGHLRSFTAGLAPDQRQQHAISQRHGTEMVHHAEAQPDRPVAFAGIGELPAGRGLEQLVVAGPVASLAGRAISADMTEDHVAPDRAQVGIVEAEAPRRRQAQIMVDDVGARHQPSDHRARAGMAQVERQRALAALAAEEGGLVGAHRVAGQRLDLYDVGAEIGEHHRR
ncbi:hypothetical protein EIK56_01395 [Sphingomonas sp. C8-2]|nr:hypothetical protein EIK56_01395 [Sphingomonas sp. C8-2]